jgi:hypothetical protein
MSDYKVGDKVTINQQYYGALKKQDGEIIGITPKGYLKIKCSYGGVKGYELFNPKTHDIRGEWTHRIYFELQEASE